MTTWMDVVVIAFLAQLAVLPGEKVQFIIAGLSTRYNPLLVVAAAGSAFAGWTVLEIALGSYVQRLLPGVYLDLLTGVLFLFFAIALLRSAPPRPRTDGGIDDGETAGVATETADTATGAADASMPDDDGGTSMLDGDLDVRVPYLGWQVPNTFGGFLPIFALMAFGEFGDKTQLVTIGLAAQYPGFPTAIWAGEMAAIIPVSLVNAFVFFRFANRFDLRTAHLLSGAAFAFFGIDTLQAIVTGVSVWDTAVDAVAAAILAIVA
ncbi:Putative Ca2+/H+ antiporter, TMEM165/GDT1 family [Halopenitus malekzadehii]|uniref:Putative Ca2+/H+ antiporter, TMEM165/GDT1 family n=1 Tax=Halopenitus malekzadehii TaxID=1267564 RepID=A0A1H6IKX6_9EURY|nr:TMEM165/GDT1 family protein [Halopenitus malekzadehii]SEH47996.1 Putative Ca2+/H+ antiporter, TMEM165/GDT1 family [Halopenitus malekzadehii]